MAHAASPISGPRPLSLRSDYRARWHWCAVSRPAPVERGWRGRAASRSGAPPRAAVQEPTAPAATAQATASLKELDALLQKAGDAQAAGHAEAEEAAITLVERLREEGVLRAFGTAQQVPKRAYSLEELRLNRIQPERFLAPRDNTLSGVRNLLQGSYLAGLTAGYFSGALDFTQLAAVVVATAFLLTADQVANSGGFEALAVDTAGRLLNRTYARRVALHEAGHFLVAYLLGLLPKGYTLSSLDAYLKSRHLNVQAGTQFCDARFQREVASGTLSSTSLDVYSCVALAGVATEWLRYDHAEGGLADVLQLDILLRALQFSQAKADSQVRWAVLNVVSLLRRHEAVQDRLADAMARGAGVAECIGVIEEALAGSSDI